MLKNIIKLDGAQQLSKNEQKEINGGRPVPCRYDYQCTGVPPAGTIYRCVNGICMLEILDAV
jgi:hypothetical protein